MPGIDQFPREFSDFVNSRGELTKPLPQDLSDAGPLDSKFLTSESSHFADIFVTAAR